MDSSTALVACGLLVSAAAWYDLRERLIPNRLVFLGMFIALLLHSMLSGGAGLGFALQGLGLGFALMLPLYLLRATGAGDVKLVTMVGSFLGPRDLVGALLCTFVVGGVLSIAIAWRNGAMSRVLENIRTLVFGMAIKLGNQHLPTLDTLPAPAAKLPYGVAIAIGTIGYLAWRHFPGVLS